MSQLDKKAEQPATSLEQMKQQRKQNDKNFDDIFSDLRKVFSKLPEKNFSFHDYSDCMAKIETLKERVLQSYEATKTYVFSEKDKKGGAESRRQLYKDQLRAVNLLEQITFVQRQVEHVVQLYNDGGIQAREQYDTALAAADRSYQVSLQEQRALPKNVISWKKVTQLIAPAEFTESHHSTKVLQQQRRAAEDVASKGLDDALSKLGEVPYMQFLTFKKYFDKALPLRKDFAEIAGQYQQLAEEVGQYLPSIDGQPAALQLPSPKESEKLLKKFWERQEDLVKKLLEQKATLEAADNPAIPSVPILLPKTSTNGDMLTIQQTLQAAHDNLDMQLKAMAGFCNSSKHMQEIQQRSPEQAKALKGFQFASFDRIVGRKSSADSKQVDNSSASVSSASTLGSSSTTAFGSHLDRQAEQLRRLSNVSGSSRLSISDGQTPLPPRGQTPSQLAVDPGDSKSSRACLQFTLVTT